MTILIADDEPAIVDLVRFTLEDPHVQIVDAADGAAAVELARRARPDVALLDVQMPRLNGLDACRQLRGLPECAHTRIVMLTAAAQAAD
ncbi:MAG TPA: response regulator, partial [Methylomirabilota bacterium]|nr:response regulator [Methylomirabilota bacterium]